MRNTKYLLYFVFHVLYFLPTILRSEGSIVLQKRKLRFRWKLSNLPETILPFSSWILRIQFCVGSAFYLLPLVDSESLKIIPMSSPPCRLECIIWVLLPYLCKTNRNSSSCLWIVKKSILLYWLVFEHWILGSDKYGIQSWHYYCVTVISYLKKERWEYAICMCLPCPPKKDKQASKITQSW